MLPSPHVIPAPRRDRLASATRGLRRQVLLGGIAVILFTVVMAVVSLVSLRSVDFAMLNLAGGACLAVLLAIPVLKKDYDVIEPISFVLMAVVVGVTLKPAYIAFGPESMHGYLLMDRQEPAFLITGSLFTLAGLSALVLGYLMVLPRAGLGRRRLFAAPTWSRERLILVALVSIAVAAASMYLYIGKLGLTGLIEDFSRKRFYEVEGASFERSALGYYRLGASVVAPMFLFFLAWALGRKQKLRTIEILIMGVLVFLASVFPFFNSSRTLLLMIFLEALVIWKCVRGRIPPWMLYATAVGLVAILLILTALRPRQGDLTDLSAVLGVDALLETTVGSRHFLDLTKTSHIIEGVPDKLEYQYGMTYIAWAFMPVPRTVWLEKPALGAGPIIGKEIFGFRVAGVPPGMIAEAYLNFGYLGILIGPFVIGLLLRWSYESFKPVLHTASGATVYAVLLIPLGWTTITGGFSQMMVSFGVAVAPLLLIMLVVNRRRTPRRNAV